MAAHVVQGLGDAGDLPWLNVTLIGATHHRRHVAAHRNAVLAGRFHHGSEAVQAFGDAAVDVLLGEAFGSGAEHSNLVGSGRQGIFETFEVGGKGGVTHAGLSGDAGHDLGGITHLWHPFRGDKAGGFDVGKAAVGQPVDQPGFDAGRNHRAGFVLQAVPGAHFHQADTFREGHYSVSSISMAINSAPSDTWSPWAKNTSLTVPSAGALMACSIFMDSMITRVWPAVTLSPAFTCTATMAPVIGAARLPSPARSSVSQLSRYSLQVMLLPSWNSTSSSWCRLPYTHRRWPLMTACR